jgi:glycosyltransferase involved in cell wall biosynthesis
MKKKIAHITFKMDIGGTERVIYNLVRNYDVAQNDVSILCLGKPIGSIGFELRKAGHKVVVFDRRPGLDLNLTKELHRYIKDSKIDILHCHQYTPFVYGVLASRLTKAKVIFTEHGRLFPDKRKIKRILVNPYFHRQAKFITAISQATRDALVKFERIPQNKIRIVYNGIEDPLSKSENKTENTMLQQMNIPSNARILGTIARLDPIKNQRMIIKAFVRVKMIFPETILLIVGDGPERNNLERYVYETGLSKSVFFSGFLDNPFPLLKLMDIFLLSSFTEGAAMTLLEAMAYSIPCIATDVGGNQEIVKDGETGFLVPSDNPEALFIKVSELIKNTEKKMDMGKAARNRFENNFTVMRMSEEYQKIYDRIA